MVLWEDYHTVTNLTAIHLQTKIDRRLAELTLQRGEPSAAEDALRRAEGRLSGSERKGRKAAARRIRARLVEPTVRG